MGFKARWALALLAMAYLHPNGTAQEGGKYSLKTSDKAPPSELSEPIRKELAPTAVQVYDPAGKLALELWFRKAIPAEVKPEQVKKGITYRQLRPSELLGAVQFHQPWKDYRKQSIKAGVYTLRLAAQPTDGKHPADIAEYPDFLLVVGAREDASPGLMDMMKLQDASGDSIGTSHPGVFMLAPNPQPGATAELAARPRNQWVVNGRSELVVGGKPAGVMGVGVTVVGFTPSE